LHFRYTAYTDGGARKGNPGEAAWGFVIYDGNVEIVRAGGILGLKTNNHAEYMALIKLLEYIKTHDLQPIRINSDSQLMVFQVVGKYRVSDPLSDLASLRKKAFELLTSCKCSLNWVPREQNTVADSIVNEVLDEEFEKRGWKVKNKRQSA
jgi:ribonuclease HI